jgi:epoxyqueuosine reductase
MSESPLERAHAVKAFAAELGFDACGIAEAGPVDTEDRLGQWLADGHHADMSWMARTKAIRQNPTEKMAGARSVVVVARNYYLPRPPAAAGAGKVAGYAWGRDYHKVLKKPLIKLARFLDDLGVNSPSYTSVDSGPVMERAWAERAGVGWIGKNSLVLRRDIGSWFFLGTVITEVSLAPDTPVVDHCGSCRACIDACPTDAFVTDGVLDARKCISYQTIENRGKIPEALHDKMEGWIFGCDICQEVCPWNRFARPSTESDFAPRPGHANPELSKLVAMDEDAFNEEFAGTPIRRAKHAGMQRNAKIAQRRGK